MKAEFINPFISSTIDVLKAECGVEVKRNGKLTLTKEAATPLEVTALIGVTGKLKGLALYSMDKSTALAFFRPCLEKKPRSSTIWRGAPLASLAT